MLQKQLPIFFFILLLAGLFWSRALLSLATGAWLIYALISLKKNPVLFSDKIFVWTCIPLLVWILGAWQDPSAKANWDYALGLAAYPATYLIIRTTDLKKLFHAWTRIWLFATLIGLSYPLYHFFIDQQEMIRLYGTGQSLPTFMDTDHVRFSIFLCSSLLLLITVPVVHNIRRILSILLLAFIIIFFSVRTGWVLLASILLLWGCWQCRYKVPFLSGIRLRNRIFIAIAFTGIFMLAFFLPTVQQKIAYSVWEWKQYQSGNYHVNHSDGVRRAVNDAAWSSIQSGAGSNTGWAGIPNALQKSFAAHNRNASTEFGWPFNQWLYWWMGSGWWGMLLFSGWLLFPALEGWRCKNFGLFAWTICITISCLAETTLNYQYGIFLHAWPLLLFWNQPAISTSDNS